LAFVTRFALFALVIFLIGAVVFPVVVVQRAVANGERRGHFQMSAATLGLVCAVLLLPVIAMRMYLQLDALRFPGDPLTLSLGPLLGQTVWGHAWILQGIGALVAAGAFALARTHRYRAPGTIVSLVAVLLLAITLSLSGHAVGGEESRRLLTVSLDAAHVIAAGTWVGTLAVMFMLGFRSASGGDTAVVQERYSLVRSFSPVALTCAAAVALTGATTGLIHINGLGDLLTTEYGRTLSWKLLFVAVVLLLGFLNWRRNTALSLSDGGVALRRGMLAELSAVVLVLLATATLVVTPPQ
jgi:putative copper resistance protein D